jgi:hypothetical protein
MRPRLFVGVETFADGLHDSEEDLRTWGRLADVLLICQREIEGGYVEADEEANHYEGQHKNLTIVIAVAGTFAVIAGIFRSVAPVVSLLGIVIEFIAISAVLAGIWSKRQPAWFLARHKAERCRFLKFRFIVDPSLWTGIHTQRAERIDKLRSEMEEIRQMGLPELRTWAEKGMVPDSPVRGAAHPAAPEDLRELIDYYVRKRLCDQMNWFKRRAQQFSYRDQAFKRLPPLLFFGSVFAALLCFTYDELARVAGVPAQIPLLSASVNVIVALSLLAGILAALGGGVRTLRSASQSARNTSRYTAAFEGLKPSFDALKEELLNVEATRGRVAQTNASAIFYHLWKSEQIMEAEHREWLRLMIHEGLY